MRNDNENSHTCAHFNFVSQVLDSEAEETNEIEEEENFWLCLGCGSDWCHCDVEEEKEEI